MNTTNLWCQRTLAILSIACVATVLAGLAAGCVADHRISVAEFVAMKDRMAAPPPAVAPSEALEADPAVLDQYLGVYRVGPDDVLAVTVTGATEAPVPSAQVRVDDQGQIDLPIVGPVMVDRMPLAKVEDAIQSAYVPGVVTQAVVHVELISAESTQVLVVGAVATPGLIPLRRTECDMLHAIAGAGGVSSATSGQVSLRRIREPGSEVVLDLTDAVQLKAALALAPLKSGDIVTVHAAIPNAVYVGGLVRRGAPQMYPSGANVTVLQALAAAGGVRTELRPLAATLIHRMPDEQDVHVRLDLERIRTGQDPNLTLAAGDILWVPETLGTQVLDFVNRNIFLRAGISVNYNVSGFEYLNRSGQQSGGGGGGLQDRFDPFGFLGRGSALQQLSGN